jgi:hypothetical protein
MRISYEPRSRAIWHTDCTNHFGGVMKPELDDEERSRTLMRCLHCRKAGWYHYGWVGEANCVEYPSPIAAVRPEEPSALVLAGLLLA